MKSKIEVTVLFTELLNTFGNLFQIKSKKRGGEREKDKSHYSSSNPTIYKRSRSLLFKLKGLLVTKTEPPGPPSSPPSSSLTQRSLLFGPQWRARREAQRKQSVGAVD